MKLITNYALDLSCERCLELCTGATRRKLLIVNKGALRESKFVLYAEPAHLEKPHVSFLFLNPPSIKTRRALGLFISDQFGHTLVSGKEWYASESRAKNSICKMGLYKMGSVIELHRFQKPSQMFELTPTGWSLSTVLVS